MVVTGVAEDGANAAAGVEVGSFILSIDGKDVVNRAQVLSLLQQTKELFAPGDPSAYVNVKLRRPSRPAKGSATVSVPPADTLRQTFSSSVRASSLRSPIRL